jgi:UDP-galactopyranose mutase
MMKYDILFIGAGLHNAVFARLATDMGYKCLVIEKRDHIGGNIYDKEINGIKVHMFGPHIFHTSDADVWNFVNKYVTFNNYVNMPIANYNGEIYNLPFNMNTFSKMWGISTPKEAMDIIESQKSDANITEPKNLEEQAISLVGTDIYKKLIKEYTEKQWGRNCIDLPSFIIKRLPVRLTYNNNYFNDKYQGIPNEGYTELIKRLFEGCDIELNVDYLKNKEHYGNVAKTIVYSGLIDEYFDYKFGKLEYRSVSWSNEKIDIPNYQGSAIVNYTSNNVPYTRSIEHKHFDVWNKESQELPYTIISKEYSVEYKDGNIPSYPIINDRNTELYNKYKELADKENNVIFGGRLAEYKYYDMDKVIKSAFDNFNKFNQYV